MSTNMHLVLPLITPGTMLTKKKLPIYPMKIFYKR